MIGSVLKYLLKWVLIKLGLYRDHDKTNRGALALERKLKQMEREASRRLRYRQSLARERETEEV